MNRIVLSTVFVVVAVSSALGQQPRSRFEVASIRPQTPGSLLENLAGALPRVRSGGLFSGTHATVASLIMFAYNLKDFQISGGPDWIRQHYYNIIAKADSPDVPVEEIRLMVQSLLEERFQLIAHVEQRQMRMHALVRIQPDGPLGPNLLPIDECNSALVNELRRKSPEKYPTPIGPGMISGCSSPGVTRLADLLTIGLDTPVIDATGLRGSFYYVLRSQFSPFAALRGSTSNDPNQPAVSTALEQQLGLRLESRRGPLDVLVIDSVQQPTEN